LEKIEQSLGANKQGRANSAQIGAKPIEPNPNDYKLPDIGKIFRLKMTVVPPVASQSQQLSKPIKRLLHE